jgi:hypothetical protein
MHLKSIFAQLWGRLVKVIRLLLIYCSMAVGQLLLNLVQLEIVLRNVLSLSLFSFFRIKIFKNLISEYLVLVEDFFMSVAKVKLSLTLGLGQSYLLMIGLLLTSKSSTVHLKG